MVAFISLFFGLLAVCAPLSNASPLIDARTPTGTQVMMRIEGQLNTIYEGVVRTNGHDVTTSSGGTHHCDGTNGNTNPSPGPTCTSALDDVAKLVPFTWDGTYDSSFDDYFVTRIGAVSQGPTQFWGLLLNMNFTPVGGCQQKVVAGDSILWAYDAFNAANFLKLNGPATAQINVPFQVTTIDASNSAAVAGAYITTTTGSSDADRSGASDSSGHVTVTFSKAGTKRIKADKPGSIRSAYLTIVVTA